MKEVDQVVIATGKAACKTARPTNAGLKELLPNPPNTYFPKPMAITPPKKAIQRGKDGGNVIPSSNPEMTADQSPTVESLFDHLHSICSVTTAAMVVVEMSRKASNPKAYTAYPTAGSRAYTTFLMICVVVKPLVR